jgi:hypothetical protein
MIGSLSHLGHRYVLPGGVKMMSRLVLVLALSSVHRLCEAHLTSLQAV